MSIPNTAYAEATVTNPSSNLTDFTLAIDLSLLPSEWWAVVNTTDGTRGRVCKGDGVTELPGDWIDFNSSNQTGVLRTKWSGTLSSSGIQTLRIYPPNTGNTSYSPSDTYGQWNSYDSSWKCYYPNGGVGDRTSAANNGTATIVVSGDSSTPLGNGTSYNGNSGFCDYGDVTYLDGSTECTAIMGSYTRSLPQQSISFFRKNGIFIPYQSEFSNMSSVVWNGGSNTKWQFTGITLNVWEHYAVTYNSSTLWYYKNGVQGSSTSIFGNFPNVSDPLYAGGAGSSESLNGILFNLQIHNIDRGAAWIVEEQNQVKDNATFWGTWIFVSAGSSNTFVHINNSWKEISDRYVKVNGQWKQITGGLVKSNGSWRIIF